MIDAFHEVRERVSAQDAARHYGLELDRAGRALCPFHNDHHPSMSFKNGRFRCWACGASGDAVDLVSQLFKLEPKTAVERLNQDFALGLPLHSKPSAEAIQRRKELIASHAAFERWRETWLNCLSGLCREAHLALLGCASLDNLSEREAFCVRWREYFEYIISMLSGTAEQQAEIYRERGKCLQWIEQTLSGYTKPES